MNTTLTLSFLVLGSFLTCTNFAFADIGATVQADCEILTSYKACEKQVMQQEKDEASHKLYTFNYKTLKADPEHYKALMDTEHLMLEEKELSVLTKIERNQRQEISLLENKTNTKNTTVK